MESAANTNGQLSRPHLSKLALITGWALALVFLICWFVLASEIACVIYLIRPEASGGRPEAALARWVLIPMLIYLLQALFYLPQKSQAPFFISARFSRFPLVFLPFSLFKRLELGPSFYSCLSVQDQRLLGRRAAERLKYWTVVPRLAFLLESHSPLDIWLNGRTQAYPKLLALPFKIIYLIMAPVRQFMRLWGFIFLRAWQRWFDPGAVDDLTDYKRKVAYDLASRALDMADGQDPENLQKQLLAALRRIYDDPDYGQQLGEKLDLATGPNIQNDFGPRPYDQASWLQPRYKGLYLDWPISAYARHPHELYDDGPEDEPDIFYPDLLGQEVEELALIRAERQRLSEILSQNPKAKLHCLDGRPSPAWLIEERIYDLDWDLKKGLKRLSGHHRRCRSSHLAAAKKIGRGWPEYLTGLVSWLHFSEQAQQSLLLAIEDLDLALEGNFQTADDDVPGPGGEIGRTARTLHKMMLNISDILTNLPLTGQFQLNTEIYSPQIDLSPPQADHLDSWLEQWPQAAGNLFNSLAQVKEKSLTLLLEAEDSLDRAADSKEHLPAAPAAPEPIAQFVGRPPRLTAPKRVYSWAAQFKAGYGWGILALVILALVLWEAQSFTLM